MRAHEQVEACQARDSMIMLGVGNPLLCLIGAIALVLLVLLVRGHFSAEARSRRRRQKSHRPVISRKQGPTVKLAAKVDKPKRDRRR